MARALDLADIQGNILRAYGRQGFPKARYVFLHIKNPTDGRKFVDRIRPSITTAVKWDESRAHYPDGGGVVVPRPKVTINIAFTFYGLYKLGLPTTTLRQLPSEFIEGMGLRAAILGDRGPDPDALWKWDPIWEEPQGERQVHALLAFNAAMNPDGSPVEDLERATQWLRDQCAAVDDGVVILKGHGRDGEQEYQDASAIMRDGQNGPVPTSKEPFGFTDGFGDPVFDGQYDAVMEPIRAIGGGAITPQRTWRALATGEFLLGYPDEAQELSGAGRPFDLTRNGTFMAYRKLGQDVTVFRDAMTRYAGSYAKVMGVPLDEAEETVRAKIAGRWSDGVPLMAAPTYAEWQAFQAKVKERGTRKAKVALSEEAGGRQQQDDPIAKSLVDFMFGDDPEGLRCPLGAHLRRANPRDMLDPTYKPGDKTNSNGSVLNNRRRILRRGLPYQDPNGDEGIVFLAICSSLFRQFEFVQQQWMNYGLDFNVASDTCPLIGNHGEDSKFVIAADPKSGQPPFFADKLPRFVEMRGGEYFFIPSMTALRLIAMGVVDPT